MRAETATRLYVGSEVGMLRRVVLHRPDLELKRLTPRNKDALLFDDVLWVKRARQEHDAFADALADRGVEVLYLEELLAETLKQPVVRDEVIARTLGAVDLGPDLGPAVAEWLTAVSAVELADRLIGGITYDELPFASDALSAQVPSLDGFVLAPLPNHLFTRDTSAWIYDGVSINAMAMRARRRESIHYDAIYRHHPLFASGSNAIWSDDLGGPAQLEGGDVLVIGNGCVLVGMGERTRPAGVERLARRLFEAGSATCVIAVEMPAQRSTMHLDTVMTMVDRDAFTIYPQIREELTAYTLRPGGPAQRGRPVRCDRPRARRAGLALFRDRRRRLRGRARAVGRRQQRLGGRTRRGCRLRAQRRHEHSSSSRGDRGHHDHRLRAGPRPRRSPLHVLPDPEG
jgi:arginine deiminase